jgi:hypothetical protein
MLHFGVDSLVEYSGERFEVSWETAQNELFRVYSKEFPETRNGIRVRGRSKTKVRVEEQQYPQTTVEQLVRNILSDNQTLWHNT